MSVIFLPKSMVLHNLGSIFNLQQNGHHLNAPVMLITMIIPSIVRTYSSNTWLDLFQNGNSMCEFSHLFFTAEDKAGAAGLSSIICWGILHPPHTHPHITPCTHPPTHHTPHTHHTSHSVLPVCSAVHWLWVPRQLHHDHSCKLPWKKWIGFVVH